jgi:hypothetical protein
MHPIVFPRSRRFMVAVAATLAALLMVAVSTAVKSAHSQTSSTTTTRAFSGYHDNPIALPPAMGKIATLKIPLAGNYVINAKLAVRNLATSPYASVQGRCVLSTSWDTDELVFDAGHSNTLTNDETLALQVVHTFAAPGSVTLSCEDNGALGFMEATDIKITAVQVGNLTNTPI